MHLTMWRLQPLRCSTCASAEPAAAVYAAPAGLHARGHQWCGIVGRLQQHCQDGRGDGVVVHLPLKAVLWAVLQWVPRSTQLPFARVYRLAYRGCEALQTSAWMHGVNVALLPASFVPEGRATVDATCPATKDSNWSGTHASVASRLQHLWWADVKTS